MRIPRRRESHPRKSAEDEDDDEDDMKRETEVAMVRPRSAYRSRGLVGAALLALALGSARPAKAYLWEVSDSTDRPVTNFKVSDVSLPKAAKLTWDYTPLGTNPPAQFTVKRTYAGVTTTLAVVTTLSYIDTFNFATDGSAYTYTGIAGTK